MSVEVTLATNGGTLAITVISTPAGWRVAHYEQEGAPLAAPPNPRLVPVRVFNNGTVVGLSAQAAKDFRADGWNVVETGNYSRMIIPTTTAYFRPDTEEEAATRALAAKFHLRVEPRFADIQNASAGVIVMTTNDYGGK